jgi:hypothetical protein
MHYAKQKKENARTMTEQRKLAKMIVDKERKARNERNKETVL